MNTERGYGKKRGIVLVTVIGVMLIVIFLVLAVIYLMTQEAYVTEHKIKRMRAYYAAMAGVVYAQDKLAYNSSYSGGSINIGGGTVGYPLGGIPVNITVDNVISDPTSAVNGTSPIRVTVNY